MEDGAIERRLVTDTAPFSLARSPDGRWLAAGTWGGTVIVWETQTWAQVAALRGHARLVDGVDFSADGLLLATASREGHARVWEVGTWRHLMATAVRPSGAERVKFLADGRHLIIGYDDGAVEVVDLRYFHRHVAGNAESRFDLLRQSEGPLPPAAAEVLEWSRRMRTGERSAMTSTAR
jgi:WD40 repeat protein